MFTSWKFTCWQSGTQTLIETEVDEEPLLPAENVLVILYLYIPSSHSLQVAMPYYNNIEEEQDLQPGMSDLHAIKIINYSKKNYNS